MWGVKLKDWQHNSLNNPTAQCNVLVFPTLNTGASMASLAWCTKRPSNGLCWIACSACLSRIFSCLSFTKAAPTTPHSARARSRPKMCVKSTMEQKQVEINSVIGSGRRDNKNVKKKTMLKSKTHPNFLRWQTTHAQQSWQFRLESWPSWLV